MSARPTSNYVRLGLFVFGGLGCLLAVLFLLGRQQNLFGSSLPVVADFRNVAGLLVGNNVRLGGITVGTVKAIELRNDTTVRVTMKLDRTVQTALRRNAIATIGTDGLVGNTIINLNPAPGPAPAIVAGDQLRTAVPASVEAMLGTLAVSNKNLAAITHDLRRMTGRLDSSALWNILSDKQLTTTVRQSLGNVAAATTQLRTAAADVQALTHGVRQGHGPLGYLLTDKTMAPQLGHAARQLAGTTDTLAATVASLRYQVQAGRGPVHTLLSDTALSGQLRQTVRNAAQSTHKLDESMVALQHNFLLRGYFRKQARQKAHATADSAARLKASASR